MTYSYCSIHHRSWDARHGKICVDCRVLEEEMEQERASDDANRDMGLPDGVDWGNK